MPTLVCDNYRVEHMEKHNRHIDELITKYLDKSLTREECAELRRYLAEVICGNRSRIHQVRTENQDNAGMDFLSHGCR